MSTKLDNILTYTVWLNTIKMIWLHSHKKECWPKGDDMNLYTWGGTYFGTRDGDDLWTHDGRHVGRFCGDEVFDSSGRYLGELRNGKLITNTSKKSRSGPSFPPPRQSCGQCA